MGKWSKLRVTGQGSVVKGHRSRLNDQGLRPWITGQESQVRGQKSSVSDQGSVVKSHDQGS